MVGPGGGAVFGRRVEVQPLWVEAFAERVFVHPGGGGRRRPWGLGSGSGGADHPAVAVGEGDPVGGVGVAGDAEFAAVVHSVVSGAQGDEVPGVGGAVVFPVDDVVHFDVVCDGAAGDAAALVAQ